MTRTRLRELWRMIRQFNKRRNLLDEHIQKWQSILERAEVNEEAITAALGDFYRLHGKQPPKSVIFCSHAGMPGLCLHLLNSRAVRHTLLGDLQVPFRPETFSGPGIESMFDYQSHYNLFPSRHSSGQFDWKRWEARAMNWLAQRFVRGKVEDMQPKQLPFNSMHRWDMNVPDDRIESTWGAAAGQNLLTSFKEVITKILLARGVPPESVLNAPFQKIETWNPYWTCLLQDYTRVLLAYPFMIWNFERLVEVSCLLSLSGELIPNWDMLQSALKNLQIAERLYASGMYAFKAFEDFAYVTLIPRTRKLDDHQRQHCADGPAIVFHDGLELYFDHGVLIPSKAVMSPEKMTVEEILKQPNAEARRVMIGKKGLPAFLKEADPVLLDADYERLTAEAQERPDPRKLYKIDLAEDEPLVVLHVIDPAKKRLGLPADVFLRVPPATETCEQAVAWSFGFDAQKDYCPIREE